MLDEQFGPSGVRGEAVVAAHREEEAPACSVAAWRPGRMLLVFSDPPWVLQSAWSALVALAFPFSKAES